MGGRVEKGGFRLYFTGSLYAASKEFSGKDTLHTAGSSARGIPRSPRKCVSTVHSQLNSPTLLLTVFLMSFHKALL